MKSLLYKNKRDIGVTRVLFKTGNELQSKPTLRTPHYYGRYPLSLGEALTVSLNSTRKKRTKKRTRFTRSTNGYLQKVNSLIRTLFYQLCAANSMPMFTALPRRGITKS